MAEKPTYEEMERKVRLLEKEALARRGVEDEMLRLREELKRREIEHDALHETTLGLMARLDLEELLETIVTNAVDLLGVKSGFMYLYDPEKDELVMKVGVGEHGAELMGLRLQPGEGLAGKVWQTGRRLLVDEYHAWPGRAPDPIFDDLRSVLGMPVKSGSRVSGVIGLAQFGASKRFGDEAVAVIERFAELASIALCNAQLYSKLQTELSERNRAEDALRESESRYRTILESIQEGYYEIDLAGNLTFFNNALGDILGYSPDELMGKNNRDYTTPESAAGIHKIFSGVYKTGTPVRMVDFEMFRKDGRKVFCELSASLIRDEKGAPIGFRGLARDVTETIKLRNQLQHAQKMEAMGRIASGVAHNFRNILSGISLNTQLILTLFSDNHALMDKMEKIVDAVKKGAQLVDDLMQFTYKRDDRRFELLDLGKVISEAYNLIRPSFDKKIDVQIDYPEFLPVMGDPSGLGQVIMNLCINACDSMPDGGRLRIEARQTPHWAEVVISDSGCGMDEETLNSCFTPFFTTKGVGKGTGLGLSTSYGIIKEHGGDIHVSSELDEGTSFRLHLPLAMGRRKKRGKSNLKIIRGGGQKVLIVDDERGILEPMREAVESLGYEAVSAASAAEALETFQSWRAEAVLLDRNMPEMDGIACAKKLFEMDPEVRIILISGYNKDGPHGIEERVGGLIKGYLTKPVDVEKMSHMLNHAFNEQGSPIPE